MSLELVDVQATQANIDVGSLVWVEDPDVAWIDGEVLEVNGDEVKVSCTSGKTVSFFMKPGSIPIDGIVLDVNCCGDFESMGLVFL